MLTDSELSGGAFLHAELFIYYVPIKETMHLTFGHGFGTVRLIFEILSVLDFQRNFVLCGGSLYHSCIDRYLVNMSVKEF